MKNGSLKIAFAVVLTCLLTIIAGALVGNLEFVSKDEYEVRLSSIEKNLDRVTAQQLVNTNQLATLLERTKDD